MLSRYATFGLILIAVTSVVSTTTLAYLLSSTAPARKSSTPPVMLYFQEGNFTAPSDWNYSLGLLNPNFRYPWNLTVVIGVNNTIEWTNHDRLAHTVTALTVPQGATLFDSGLISPGQNFIVTLSVPGLYKFDCAWHPWLAGVITVKSS